MKCVPHPIVKFEVKINPFKFGHFSDGYQTGSFINFYLSKKTHDMVRPAFFGIRVERTDYWETINLNLHFPSQRQS